MRQRRLSSHTAADFWCPGGPRVYVIHEPDRVKAQELLAQLRAAGDIAFMRQDRPDEIEVIHAPRRDEATMPASRGVAQPG